MKNEIEMTIIVIVDQHKQHFIKKNLLLVLGRKINIINHILNAIKFIVNRVPNNFKKKKENVYCILHF